MKFTTESATKPQRKDPPVKLPGSNVQVSDNGDPLQLSGTRVVLTRSTEQPGTIRGSTADYRPVAGAAPEARAFVRLDAGCTAWFPIDDLEPEEEEEVQPEPSLAPGPVVDFWG